MTRPSTLILLATATMAHGVAGAGPLHDHDNGPLIGIFGFPDSTEGARLVAEGRIDTAVYVVAASHSIIEQQSAETIILDGETKRSEFRARYGIADGFEIGIEVPYVWHETGGLDPLIQDWHDAFGFPGEFRESRAHNQLEFRYTGADGNIVETTENVRGPGDVRLFGGWQLPSRGNHSLALRAGIKLPTGDSETLLGSGGLDLSLGVAGDLQDWFGRPGLSAFYRLSAVWLGKPAYLEERAEPLAAQLAFGTGYAFGETFELRAQASVRSAVYDSEIESLGQPSAALTVGGNIRLGERWRLSLAVAEDIKVRSAPDVSFQLALAYRP